MRAHGTQGTPLRSKCDFSNARCWHTVTASAAGATGNDAARRLKDPAGTFSNSVVTASHSVANAASAASSS